MNFLKLQKLKGKKFVSVEDIARAMGIKHSSANVLASRYAKKGLLVRLKKNLYILPEKFASSSREDLFGPANFLQVPSYISLMPALLFYGITTQMQRNFFENISWKRSKNIEIKKTVFKYFKIKKELFSSFVKRNGYFIPTPEKAFVDALYLYSLNRYALDIDSSSLEKLDKERIVATASKFPLKTQKLIKEICRI